MEKEHSVNEKFAKYEEYCNYLSRYANFLEKHLTSAKMLVKNGYEIFDLNQANQDFRKMMKLDETNTFDVEFFDKNTSQKLTITRNNFWNGFYKPIWKKLDLQKRMLVCEWLFDSINGQYNLGVKSVSYIPVDVDDRDFLNCDGYMSDSCKNKSVFINIDNVLKKASPLDALSVIVHELEHVKQSLFIKKYSNQKENSLYVQFMKNTDIDNDCNAQDFLNLKNEKQYEYYRCLPYEKSAELQALKRIKKYKQLNEKTFGKNEKVDREWKKFVQDMLFDEGKYDENGKSVSASYGIIYNERKSFSGNVNFIQKVEMLQFNNITKIYKLDEHCETINNKIEELKKQKNTSAQIEKLTIELDKSNKALKEVLDKNDYYTKTFRYILRYSKLPKYFDAKEFETLNIDDNKTVELPKYLKEFDK